MFARLGSLAVRFRWPIIAVWLAAAAALTLLAPNIDEVAVSDQRSFLPMAAPSLEAHELLSEHFPDRVSPSSAVIVIDAGADGRVDGGDAAAFVAGLTSWLDETSGADPSSPLGVVDRVVSPVLGDELTRAGLTSDDGQVALVLVRFHTIGTQPETKAAIAAIEERLAQAPAGLQTYMTGDGPILAAYNTATRESVDSTTWITIVLVIVILLLIYRSPVSPLIPLATIALAYLITRGVVAFLGAHVMTISSYTNIFLIVVLFGAGTDYCLFLISRFREEMAGAGAPAPAVKTTVRAVGETIASSAGTVIVGVAMMAFAELGLYNTSGPSIAIGVGIALVAGLTLTPALLMVLGHRAFWPRRAHRVRKSGAWHSWAGMVVKRPWPAFLAPLVVLVPLAVYGNDLARNFDLLGDLSESNEARMGFEVLAEHFGAGEMQPLTVLLVDADGYDTPAGLARTRALETQLEALPHVTLVRSFNDSLPDDGTLSVAGQLATVAQEVHDGITALQAAAAGGAAGGDDGAPDSGGDPAGEAAGGDDPAGRWATATAGLTRVYGYLVELAASYPEVLQEPGYAQAANALADLAALAQAVGGGASGDGTQGSAAGSSGTALPVEEAFDALESLAAGLDALHVSFAGRTDAILLPDLYLQSNQGLSNLRNAYFSAEGDATRLQVVLDTGPYSPEAIGAVEKIRRIMADGGLQGAVEGNSAVLLDLRDASDRDLTRAFIFVLGGVFVVLLLLLRALVAPIYLILTILLSYAATLGVTRLLFVDILGQPGITWWVPMFMFVMLVALGMDYNIFLIGRVKEEVALHGTRDGTRRALARTGGIITSAGIIMAGTFASMLSGSLMGLLQIGFAVAFGVLLDTFVVRTTLVPALTVL
ncbi:MAG: MMPL family transporter, partial [Thermoleophilia bacterium]|nr:MMPL family transporter [Thermoleophilia bacterium]